MAGAAVGTARDELVGYGDVPIGGFQDQLERLLIQGAQSSSTFIVTQVKGIAQNVLLFTVNFYRCLVYAVFLPARWRRAVGRMAQRLLPMDREASSSGCSKTSSTPLLAVVHGSLVVAMVQGCSPDWAYWVLGVPVCGVVGRGHGLCRTAAGGRLDDRFDSGVDLPVSARAKRCEGIFMLIWGLGCGRNHRQRFETAVSSALGSNFLC